MNNDSPARALVLLERARRILALAREDLGHDLGGHSAVDLLLDQDVAHDVEHARQLLTKLGEPPQPLFHKGNVCACFYPHQWHGHKVCPQCGGSLGGGDHVSPFPAPLDQLDVKALRHLADLKGGARLEAAAPYLLAAVEDVLEETCHPRPEPQQILARLRLSCLSAYVLALGPIGALEGLRLHRAAHPAKG